MVSPGSSGQCLLVRSQLSEIAVEKNIKLTLSFLVAMLLLTSCDAKYTAWYSAGPIQIIGNKAEIWLFLEFDRQVKKEGHYYDVPNTYPIGHFQEVLIVDNGGLRERTQVTRLNNLDGVTFHPNNARIFRYDNALYLYSFPSMYYEESFFKWDDNIKRFVLLPAKNASVILKELPSRETFGSVVEGIKKISEKYDWKILYTDSKAGNDTFIWNGKKYALSFSEGDYDFELKIENSGDPIILAYKKEAKQISHDMFEKLSREERGYPKHKR